MSPETELIESDAELIKRLQRGDRHAFTVLVRRWEGPLLRIAYRITGEITEAEDVRQRVFLKLLEASGTLHRPEQFPAWIRRAAVNTALTALRRSKRREGLNHRLSEQMSSAGEAHPADRLIEDEQARRLAAAMAQFEPKARALLSLRFDDGLTFGEIAGVLGQPASTIKSRLAKIVGRLRGLMATQGT